MKDKDDTEYTGRGRRSPKEVVQSAVFQRQALGDLLTEVINIAKTLSEFTTAALTEEEETDARSRHTLPREAG